MALEWSRADDMLWGAMEGSTMTDVMLVSVLMAALEGGVAFAQAKRLPPPQVTPVHLGDTVLEAPNDDGLRGYIRVAQQGKTLWEVTLYTCRPEEGRELDVQFVYLTRMSLKGTRLKAEDEAGRIWWVDLKTRAVKQGRRRPRG